MTTTPDQAAVIIHLMPSDCDGDGAGAGIATPLAIAAQFGTVRDIIDDLGLATTAQPAADAAPILIPLPSMTSAQLAPHIALAREIAQHWPSADCANIATAALTNTPYDALPDWLRVATASMHAARNVTELIEVYSHAQYLNFAPMMHAISSIIIDRGRFGKSTDAELAAFIAIPTDGATAPSDDGLTEQEREDMLDEMEIMRDFASRIRDIEAAEAPSSAAAPSAAPAQ